MVFRKHTNMLTHTLRHIKPPRRRRRRTLLLVLTRGTISAPRLIPTNLVGSRTPTS